LHTIDTQVFLWGGSNVQNICQKGVARYVRNLIISYYSRDGPAQVIEINYCHRFKGLTKNDILLENELSYNNGSYSPYGITSCKWLLKTIGILKLCG